VNRNKFDYEPRSPIKIIPMTTIITPTISLTLKSLRTFFANNAANINEIAFIITNIIADGIAVGTLLNDL